MLEKTFDHNISNKKEKKTHLTITFKTKKKIVLLI